MARTSSLVLALAVGAYAKKVVEVEAKGMIGETIDGVMGLVGSVYGASLAVATDTTKLLMGVPSTAVDLYVWGAATVRDAPDMVKKIASGDSGTLDSMASFASDMAAIVFCVYAALTALNLALGVALGAKDYFNSYLTLPTSLPGLKKLPGPVKQARDLIQKEVLDRIKGLAVGGWIIPLEGQSGKPSLSQALPVLASATSVCVVLGCAPALLSIIQKGADKKAAEDLIYTMGMAVGLQYVVKRVA